MSSQEVRTFVAVWFLSAFPLPFQTRSIMEKLHLANRSQAAAYAVERGLVQYREQ